jgi:hypothetical protein
LKLIYFIFSDNILIVLLYVFYYDLIIFTYIFVQYFFRMKSDESVKHDRPSKLKFGLNDFVTNWLVMKLKLMQPDYNNLIRLIFTIYLNSMEIRS